MRVDGIAPRDVAAAMNMDEAGLWNFARNIERHFKPPRLQRVGRKDRIIDAMYYNSKRRLKLLHKWFQAKRLFHTHAHGGIKGRSSFTSAEGHLGKKGVWVRDASDCYPSVTPDAFRGELLALGFRADTAALLTMLCTVRGRIPQGSPVSGDALNLFFWRIDQGLSSFAGSAKKDRYSRMADDFVFSGNPNRGHKAVQMVERELAARGVRINVAKKRKSGYQPNSALQHAHSIRLNNRRGTTISDDHWAESLVAGDKYLKACRAANPDSLLNVSYKRQQLHGWLYYCRQARFGPSKHLEKLLEAGDRIVRRKLLSAGLSAKKGKWWLREEPKRLAALWRRRFFKVVA